MPVVGEGTKLALYTSVATQVSVEAVATAPVSLILLLTRARALVVHGVCCQQSMADILYKV